MKSRRVSDYKMKLSICDFSLPRLKKVGGHLGEREGERQRERERESGRGREGGCVCVCVGVCVCV